MLVLVVPPFLSPSFITPQFKEFFRLGRVLRTTLPTGKGGVVHLFVVYGYQGAEEDADPAVIPCLSKGISSGRFVDLALACSRGAGIAPDATCRFSREGGAGSRGDFLSAVPMHWLLRMPALLLIGGSLLTFQFLLAFALVLGWLMLLARLFVNLSGLLVGWILLISPPRRLLVLFKMSVMFIGMSLLLMIFGLLGVVMLRRVYFGPIQECSVLLYSFVGVLSLLRMCLKVSGVGASLSPGGMLYWGDGVPCVVMVRVVLSPLFIPGMIGFLQISMAFSSGCLIPLRC